MEFRQLGYFIAVAEERNFTRAAERLLVAQPAVSRQVRQLERELGARLFERTPRDVVLTSAGEALLPVARDTLEALERAREEVAAAAGVLQGKLAVGCLFGAPRLGLPSLLTTFHRHHPMIDVAVSQDMSERLLANVRAGTCDVAFVSPTPGTPPPGLAGEIVDQETAVLVVAHGHRLAERDNVTLAELQDETFIALTPGTGQRAIVEGACRAAGFTPHIALSVQSVSTLAEMAAEGIGITFLPETVAPSNGLHPIRIEHPLLARRIRMVWRSAQPLSPCIAAFLELADKHFDAADTAPRQPWDRPL